MELNHGYFEYKSKTFSLIAFSRFLFLFFFFSVFIFWNDYYTNIFELQIFISKVKGAQNVLSQVYNKG